MTTKPFALLPFCFLCLCASRFAFSVDSADDENLVKDIQSYSQRLGYEMAGDLEGPSDFHDLEYVIKGVQQYIQGGSIDQEITEQEFESLQKRFFERQAKQNRITAEATLQSLAQKSGIQRVRDNFILYEILEKGQGKQPLSKADSVLVRYEIVNACSEVIYSSDDKDACLKPLDDFLPSIAQAMIGMVEGEKRRIYVHPDFSYGNFSRIKKDGLLIVDVSLRGIKPATASVSNQTK